MVAMVNEPKWCWLSGGFSNRATSAMGRLLPVITADLRGGFSVICFCPQLIQRHQSFGAWRLQRLDRQKRPKLHWIINEIS